MSLEDTLKGLRDLYEKSLEECADMYRSFVIIPLCQKYGINFYQGMGTWFFARPDAEGGEGIEDEVDATEQGIPELIPVLADLNREVGNGPNDCFGFYVEEYRGE